MTQQMNGFAAMDVIDITQGDLLGYIKTALRASDTTLSVDWLPERGPVSDMLLVEYLPGQVVTEAVGLLSGPPEHPIVMRALHQTAATTFKVGSEVRAMKSVVWKVERRA